MRGSRPVAAPEPDRGREFAGQEVPFLADSGRALRVVPVLGLGKLGLELRQVPPVLGLGALVERGPGITGPDRQLLRP